MPGYRTSIRHVFGGGWATDFGPVADLPIAADGSVIIPFLVEAENTYYEYDGGPHKIGGTTKFNAAAVASGASVRGCFDYWKQGTGGSPAQRIVAHAGTLILQASSNGVFSTLFSGVNATSVPNYNVFDDMLIIASDSDAPRSWDQSTAQLLAGSPPSFAFSVTHKGRVWAAGVDTDPSGLYYSAYLNPEDWTGAGSGRVSIDPNDGDKITGLASHKGELFVFKGPYKGSIHRIAGSAPTGSDSFSKAVLIRGVGASGHNSIFRFRDDLGFIWRDGTIRSLAATASFGDFQEATLSRPINTYLRDRVSHENLSRAWAATFDQYGIVVIGIPIDSSSTNNQMLMMDYRFSQGVRWAYWSSYADFALCPAPVIESGLPVLMSGGADGYVRRLLQSQRRTDTDLPIAMKVMLPSTSYSTPNNVKTLCSASLGVAPKGSFTADLLWKADSESQQTETVSQGGGDVLGPSSASVFTLDSSTLSGAEFSERRIDLHEGGEFRYIQWGIRNVELDEDLEVHTLSCEIMPGSHSLEAD